MVQLDDFTNAFTAEEEIPPRNSYWFGFFILVVTVFMVIFLANPTITNPGLIYVLLSIISLGFLLGAFFSDNQFFGFVLTGVDDEPWKIVFDMVVGAVIGITLVSGIIGFSIAYNPSPFAITSPIFDVTGSTLINGLVTLVIIGFLGVEAEEMFRASTLLPSILRYTGMDTIMLSIYSGSALLCIILLFFLIQFLSTTTFLIVLAILAIDIGISLFYKPARDADTHPLFNTIQTIFFTSLIFMLLHVLAYGQGSYTTNAQSFAAAFVFAFIIDIVNLILGSTLASRIAHSINNSVLTCVALGLSLWFGAAIVLIYAGFLAVVGSPLGNDAFNYFSEKAPAIQWLIHRSG
jgi:hypothetical protein